MPPLLDNPPLVEDDDPVGATDGGEPVRDDDGGPALEKAIAAGGPQEAVLRSELTQLRLSPRD